MARLYVFECPCGKLKTAKRVEYTPPSNAKYVKGGRYIIDYKLDSDHDGYPSEVMICECGREITNQAFDLNKVPPVYFNYMGDED